jgi:cysteine desulfurase
MDTIYLDHNATTPLRPEAAQAMARCGSPTLANPASQHGPGRAARHALDEARRGIAELLGADLSARPPDRLLLTSGGTEANNAALWGMARASLRSRPVAGSPGHAIVSAIEHPCVAQAAEHLLDAGWNVDMLGVDRRGVVRVERLVELLREETRLVSVIAANHETGAIQPIAEAAAECHRHGAFFHTDAVQTAGKLPMDFRALGLSAMSIAAHKFGGPVGIGALLLAPDVPFEPLLVGGAQQEGLRPGTEPVALAVGMHAALGAMVGHREELRRHWATLRERFEDRIKAGWPEVVVHAADAPRLEQTVNLGFPGIDAQMLFTALDTAGVACSIGAACSSGAAEPSATLMASEASRPLAGNSLRFSFGHDTTRAECDRAAEVVLQCCRRIGRS